MVDNSWWLLPFNRMLYSVANHEDFKGWIMAAKSVPKIVPMFPDAKIITVKYQCAAHSC